MTMRKDEELILVENCMSLSTNSQNLYANAQSVLLARLTKVLFEYGCSIL